MKTHTTLQGDRFLQNHIADNTPWQREAYREAVKPRTLLGYFMLLSAASLGVLGLLAIVTFLSV